MQHHAVSLRQLGFSFILCAIPIQLLVVVQSWRFIVQPSGHSTYSTAIFDMRPYAGLDCNNVSPHSSTASGNRYLICRRIRSLTTLSSQRSIHASTLVAVRYFPARSFLGADLPCGSRSCHSSRNINISSSAYRFPLGGAQPSRPFSSYTHGIFYLALDSRGGG